MLTDLMQYLALGALAVGWWLLLGDTWRSLRASWARRAQR